MTLEIPFNTEANLVLNQSELESLTINGESFKDFQKNNKSGSLQGTNVILGSGHYKIQYKK